MNLWLSALMPLGTWGEWVGGIGSAAAAVAAVVLLKREGDDRKELQQAEQRRIENERRTDASRMSVRMERVSWGTSGPGRVFADYKLELHNGSDSVMNDVIVEPIIGAGVTPPSGGVWSRRPRMFPGDRRVHVFHYEADDEGVDLGQQRELVTGVTVHFCDARGVCWQIDREHRLHEVSAGALVEAFERYPETVGSE